MKPDINHQTLVEDLVREYPFASRFLSDRGLQCIICGEPVWGTLEELALDNNFTEQQISQLITDLKQAVSH
ncbi:hypothetical protein SDC9_21797 [bioreactor metagenome]|uniref:DUF1858 domain-containing protein n=1 Tax=bioreactor metagenome TaxID=1076179 RepID=A0A644UAR4_9ZZZZ|nr:hypothetical protein [Lentimicrobium sp.]MEA5109021.1 hypothetical protein [Lentimicrobium sp.]